MNQSNELMWAIKNGDLDQVKEIIEKQVGQKKSKDSSGKGKLQFSFFFRFVEF